MTRVRLLLALSCVAVLAAGCRSKDNGDSPDAQTSDGDSIQDVQNDSMPVGTPVTLKGVVVVAIDTFGARTGGFYVMEPDGGPFSGVFVFAGGGQSATLQVGDLVDIEGGVKDEFALSDDTTGRTLTEISEGDTTVLTVTRVGTGSVPAPQVVTPWELAADDAEAEKWESVLIKFENVSVLSAPRNVSSSDTTLKEMRVTGPFAVSSSLTDLADSIARDDCYAEIVGLGDYFFNYKVLPRSSADLVGGGSGCPAQEEGDTACGDQADNDHDGFEDCNDFSCQETVAACVTNATVVEVQDETYTEPTAVTLSGVVVTAIDRDRFHFWVQDSGVTAQHNGVYVYRGNDPGALDSAIQVGELVDIKGNIDEFYGSTQIQAETVTPVSGGPVAVTEITNADSTMLGDIVTGDPYEGTIVTFTDIPVINDSLEFGQISIGSGTPLIVDDTLYSYNPIGTTCLAKITGVVILNTFDNFFYLAPRSAADIEINGTCN